MGRLSFFFKRLVRMDWKAMWKTAGMLQKPSGKSRLWLLADMLRCALKYNAGYVDYKIAQMYRLNDAQRKTQITRGLSNQIVRRMNDKAYWYLFDDKATFNELFAAEVGRHMDYEDKHIHTYVNDLMAGVKTSPDINIHKLSHQHHDNHAQLEKSLSELKSIIIKYYPNDSNAQLLNDVLIDLFMTEEDLFSHCHLEDTLFLEAVVRLEDERREQTGEESAQQEEPEPDNTTTDTLSEREKEVIVCVVKGMANKEIADQLYISVNTVMTHRRNISRKLQIHSPAGLTIYAIVNGLI